jgi:hypothetical protein
MQPDQGELEREHWHVAMMRVTGHPDGTRSYASRQVEIDYPTAVDAAAVIAQLEHQEFPLYSADTVHRLTEMLAANPGMPTIPSPDRTGDHYTVLRCVRSGDDCIQTADEWMRTLMGGL